MTLRSAGPEQEGLDFTDSPQRTAPYCGGLAGVLFVGVVLGVGMLTTIIALTLYVVKFVGRVTRGY